MRLMILLVSVLATACTNLKTTEPLYTEKEMTAEPALEGKWIPLVDNEAFKEAQITSKNSGYIFRQGIAETGVKNYYTPLFKLGPHFLYELSELNDNNKGPEKGESRPFGKIALIEGRLFITPATGNSIRRVLAANPDAIPTEQEKLSDLPDCIILKGMTDKNRAFLSEHFVQAFEYEQEAYRRPADSQAPVSKIMQTKEQETFEVVWLLWSTTRLMTYSVDSFSRVMPGNITAEKEAEWRQRYQTEFFPRLELPESQCDPRVAKLYKEVRAALADLYENVTKEQMYSGRATPLEPTDANDPEARKKADKKTTDKLRLVEKDPLAWIAREVAPEGDRRTKFEALGKRLMDLVAEMEIKYKIKFAAE